MYVAVDESGAETRMAHLMPESLVKMMANGTTLYREGDDGTRTEVTDPEDVLEIEPEESVTLVAPVYVDDRMLAVVDVFDAMAAELTGVATMSAEDPMTFAEAMERLREIVGKGASFK